MYRESCEEKDQRLQDRLKQTQIQVLGDMPPTAPVIEEEDPVEEDLTWKDRPVSCMCIGLCLISFPVFYHEQEGT